MFSIFQFKQINQIDMLQKSKMMATSKKYGKTTIATSATVAVAVGIFFSLGNDKYQNQSINFFPWIFYI